MELTMQEVPAVRWRTWAARAIQVLVIAFLVFDAVTKLLRVAPVVEATAQLGYPLGAIAPIGATLLALTILYAIPRTAVLGAVLLTGYLGGAVATQVRIAAPPFSIAFPVIFAALVWAAPFLTDERVRALLVRR